MAYSSLSSNIRLEGALFSRDFLMQLSAPQPGLQYLDPQSYGLSPDMKLREAIAAAWNKLNLHWKRFDTDLGKLPNEDHATAVTRREWLLPVLHELGFGRVQPAAPIRIATSDGNREYAISHGWNRTPIHLLGARIPLGTRTANVPGAAIMAPHALVQECLNRSPQHLWAIVSNGCTWRLLRDSAAMSRQSFVEFDLAAIFEGQSTADFAAFWLMCHASRFEWRTAEGQAAAQPLEAGDEAPDDDDDDDDDVVEAAPPNLRESEPPILELWLQGAAQEGSRALDHLRDSVQAAIQTLGAGFLCHPANCELRTGLQSGALPKAEFYRLVLRLVYRMLFLLMAETKGALLPENAGREAALRYEKYYSLTQLRARTAKTRGTHHGDGWQALRLVCRFFRSGEPGLAVPALGGFLFEEMLLDRCELSNAMLFKAVRELCFFRDGAALRPVNFNLGSEELGSVYEALLELSPNLDVDARSFSLDTLAGNERKTTGSYYTPESLVKSLLDSALGPVLDRAAGSGEEAILALKVCDPACGSGHFLTAAARRIAGRLALLRSGGDEPSPQQQRHALRDVVGRCIYGIDLNPMAVELCKVALWMESLEPGKPLGFLDSHIRAGNSLLGTTPALVAAGLPDEALKPIEGDNSAICAELRRQNKRERNDDANKTRQSVFEFEGDMLALGNLRQSLLALEIEPEDKIEDVKRKEEMLRQYHSSPHYESTHLLYDAWCAAFVWKKQPQMLSPADPAATSLAAATLNPDYIEPLTHGGLRHIERHARPLFAAQTGEIKRLAAQYRWFHPHLEFADVFGRVNADEPATTEGGFDVVLGNPPWERVKLQEKEWFAQRDPAIATAANAAARRRLIDGLRESDPALYAAFIDDRRRAEGESHFVRDSGRYPLCGRGDVNTYALFAELNRSFIDEGGRVGCIVPTGIATDDTTKLFFDDLNRQRSLVSLFDFENREKIFPAVDSRMKFSLLTLCGAGEANGGATFVFFALRPDQTEEAERRFKLTPGDIALLNPNTRTCPIFRSNTDAELTKAIYRRVPVLVDEERGEQGNPWGIRFGTMFHMSNDSGLFRTRAELEQAGLALHGNQFTGGGETFLPLYEAKMLHHYDHRWATYDGEGTRDTTQAEKQDPNFSVMPRYWVAAEKVDEKLEGKWEREWLLGWRDITNTTNERTVIASLFPRVGVGHKEPLILCPTNFEALCCLYANINSKVLDYLARQKLGGTSLTYFIFKQLPILPPQQYENIVVPEKPCSETGTYPTSNHYREWISTRVLELTYTTQDMAPFARDLGYDGPPFAWDPERRFQLRCELDAAFFHLYGLSRDETAYVLDTFPIVRRKNEAVHGCYRTKETILRMYDEMATGA